MFRGIEIDYNTNRGYISVDVYGLNEKDEKIEHLITDLDPMKMNVLVRKINNTKGNFFGISVRQKKYLNEK
jgi:hypothetical protein